MQSEITVQVLCDRETLFQLLRSKGFKYMAKLNIHDYYYTHMSMDKNIDFKDLASNSFLLRDLRCADFKSRKKSIMYTRLTYKKKEFDLNNKVVSEKKIATDICDVGTANIILQSAGLTNWCTKHAIGYGFIRGGQYILVQEVEGLGLYMEVEQFDYQKGSEDEILDELVEFVNELEIPVGTNYHESISYLLHLKTNKKVKFGFNPSVK